MSGIDEGNFTVRYSPKELFARIDFKLDAIAGQLTAKADHDALVALDDRVTRLETIESERRGYGKAQAVIIGLLLAIAGLLVPIAVNFLP